MVFNACGKSTLSHEVRTMLRESFGEEVNVLGTDYLKGPYRYEHPLDQRFKYNSYESWQRFGDPTRANVLRGFSDYREALDPYVRTALDFTVESQSGLVVEGVHPIPSTFIGYQGHGIDVRMLLLSVMDETTHRGRFAAKSGHHPSLFHTFETHFERIRWIQDYLLEEAVRSGVTTIDTGQTLDQTLATIRAALSSPSENTQP